MSNAHQPVTYELISLITTVLLVEFLRFGNCAADVDIVGHF